MKKLKELVERKETLVDKVYMALKDIPEFKDKSMDEQGKLSMKIAKLLK